MDKDIDDDDEYSGEAADAAQAFEALQREVALQRQAIEALGNALEVRAVPDLTVDIAKVLKGQAQVSAQVEALRGHPVLQLTPEQYGRALAQSGGQVVRDAVQALERATQEVQQERAQLTYLVDTVRTVRQDKRVLAWRAGTILVIGLLLSPVLVRLMPMGMSSHVAAFVVGKDRWLAGWALLETVSPTDASRVASATRLVIANEGVVAACRDAATKAKRDQRCTITVLPL